MAECWDPLGLVTGTDTSGQGAPPRDIGAETRETLLARIGLADDLRKLQSGDTMSQYQTAIDLLRGKPAWSETSKAAGGFTEGSHASPVAGTSDWQKINQAWASAGYTPTFTYDGYTWNANNIHDVTTQHDAMPGYFDIISQYQPDYNRMMNEQRRSQRTEQLQALQDFGPGTYQALRAYDPAKTSLIDELASQAQSELANGGFDPFQTSRDFTRAAAAQSDRGFGWGGNDATARNYYLMDRAYDRRANARQFASGVASQRNQVYDPFLMGLTSARGAELGGSSLLGGANAASSAPQFDPFNGYASDLYNTNFNTGWQNLWHQQGIAAADTAGRQQFAGSIMGSASKMI
jgi:hypothetical protein